jgi:hypothetical protein
MANCIESGAEVEAIEVPSSHYGLPYRAEVFQIIVERLARSSEGRRTRATVAAVPPKRPSADLTFAHFQTSSMTLPS